MSVGRRRCGGRPTNTGRTRSRYSNLQPGFLRVTGYDGVQAGALGQAGNFSLQLLLLLERFHKCSFKSVGVLSFERFLDVTGDTLLTDNTNLFT